MKQWKPLIAAITVAILGSMMLFAFQQGKEQLEVIWGKQWGTVADELVSDIALDKQGNIYISGGTKGNLFGQNQGDWDIYVIKLDSKGQILWSKQLGSEGNEEGCEMALDREGNIYLFTGTGKDWFGKNLGIRDVILLKLSPNGKLLWGKRIGTSKDEVTDDIAVDHQSYVYILGSTTGDLFAKNRSNHYESFLVKLDFDGKVVWGKQFSKEHLGRIVVDNQSKIYVTGLTASEVSNKLDLFIDKFDSDWKLIWKKVFAPNEISGINSIDFDKKGNIYVAGYGLSHLPESDEVHYIPDTLNDALIAKYNEANGQMMWSKRFSSQGGEIAEEFEDVVVDEQGYVYVVGETKGKLFGEHLGDDDVILAKFDGEGKMIWGKQWGSVKGETGVAIVIDKQGNIYITGGTDGDLFRTNVGEVDIFVVKFKQ